MTYRIGICDDEVVTCSQLEGYINDYFKMNQERVETYVWNSGVGLKTDLPKKINLDILFLDIELPECNGVEVGRYIRETIQNDAMHIIYISSKTSYAMELFRFHPYDFFVKPLNQEQINGALDKLIQLDALNQHFYTYSMNKEVHKISMGEIIYFESDRKHIHIITKDGQDRIFVGKLKDEMIKLPDNFVMIGQSYIINLRHMMECHGNYLIMDNHIQLNISRAYKTAFNKKLLESHHSGGTMNVQ